MSVGVVLRCIVDSERVSRAVKVNVHLLKEREDCTRPLSPGGDGRGVGIVVRLTMPFDS